MLNPCGYDGCLFMDVANDQRKARLAQARLIAAAPRMLAFIERIANGGDLALVRSRDDARAILKDIEG